MRSCFLLLLCFLLSATALQSQQQPRAVSEPTPRFTENRGQIVDVVGRPRPDILFTARTGNANLYLRTSGLSYVFAQLDRATSAAAGAQSLIDERPRSNEHLTLYRLDVEFVGANPQPRVTRAAAGEDYANYYLAHCPQGVLGVRNYGEVVYHDIYPKIDLVLRTTEEGVKSEFVVRPGGNPAAIRMRYNGGDKVSVLKEGSLQVTTMLGGLDDSAPYSFTEGEEREIVESRYEVVNGEVRFALGRYNRSRVLVIDPLTRTWATCVGGSLSDYGLGVASSRDGGVYLSGHLLSADFPVTVGAFQTTGGGPGPDYDLFLMRLTAGGARRWATYIGGSGDETGGAGHMLAASSNNDIAIVGSSISGDFPTTNTAYQRGNSGVQASAPLNEDAVVAVFDNTGARRWATYLGGSRDANGLRVAGNDRATGAAYDYSGNLVVTGYAFSQDFPVTASAFQITNQGGSSGSAFVAKFSAGGGLNWSTYLSGTGGSSGNDLAIGDSDKVYVGGRAGIGFPTTSNAYQTTGPASGSAFVSMLDSTGAQRWATYFGPTYSAQGIAVDAAGAVTIVGETSSSVMPTTPGAYRTVYLGGAYDAFVAKLSANGSRLLRSTFFGSPGEDRAFGLTLDKMGGVWVSGFTTNAVLPISAGAFQMGYGGGSSDAFLLQFDSAGRLLYSSFYGGAGTGNAGQDVSTDVAFDSAGALYISGYTESLSFPTTAGAFQMGPAGSIDAFLVKFDCQAPTPSLDSNGVLCAGDAGSSVVLTAGTGYRNYRWSTGDTTRAILVRSPGSYSLTVIDSMGCISPLRTITVRERPRPGAGISSSSPMLCPGDSVVLQAGPVGPFTYRWNTGSTAQQIVVRDSGLYTVQVTDSSGCSAIAQMNLRLFQPVRPVITPSDTFWLCAGDSVQLASSENGYVSWQWSNGRAGQKIVVRDTGNYSVTVIDTNGCHLTSAPVIVRRRAGMAVRILPQGSTTLCAGDSVALVAVPGGAASYRWSNGAETPMVVVRNPGVYRVQVIDKYGCKDSAAVTVTVMPLPKPKLLIDGVVPLDGPLKLCEGDSILLKTSIDYTQVVWSDGLTGSSRMITDAGRYVARVKDINGCSGVTDTVDVIVIPRPVIDMSGPVAVCAGSRASYTVTARSGVRYTWSVGNGTVMSGNGTGAVSVQWSGAGAGWIRLQALDLITGCQRVDSVGVQVGSMLSPLVRTSRPTTLCPGDSVVLDAGDGYANYRWSTGATSRTITVRVAGNYTVSVQDSEGCSGVSDTIRVRLNAPPTPTIISTLGSTICDGDSTVLGVAETFAAYRWSTGETTPTITVRGPGAYSVEVEDTVGCVGTSAPFNVTLSIAPRPEIDGPNAVCVGAEEVYVVGDSIALPVVWKVEGGTIVSGDGTRTVKVRWGAVGAGKIIATAGAGGCRRSEEYPVSISTELHPHLLKAGVIAICVGDSVELVAPGGYAGYRWSTGERSSSIVVRGAGEYWVEVEATGGCRGVSDTALVIDAGGPEPTIVAGSLNLCAGDSTLLDAGAGYARYHWSTGERTQTIVVRTTGAYTVSVQAAGGGCWGRSDAVAVTVHTPATPTITEVGEELETNPALSYQWQLEGADITGATSQRFKPARSGNYTVATVDSNGCAATSAPHHFVPTPSTSPHRLVLDTIHGNVGELLTMNVRIIPPLDLSDDVRGYRVQISYDPRALYLLRATSGVVGLPDPVLLPLGHGSAEIVMSGAMPLSGALLARLELLGLVTGQPVNIVALESVELEGVDQATHSGGIVLLSGCDVGRTGNFERAVAIVGTRLNGGEVSVRYRSPLGSLPHLVLYDFLGRVVDVQMLEAGTGAEQEVTIGGNRLPSGMYRLELRDRAERDGAVVVMQR